MPHLYASLSPITTPSFGRRTRIIYVTWANDSTLTSWTILWLNLLVITSYFSTLSLNKLDNREVRRGLDAGLRRYDDTLIPAYLTGWTDCQNLVSYWPYLLLEPCIWLMVPTVKTLSLTACTYCWDLVSDSLHVLSEPCILQLAPTVGTSYLTDGTYLLRPCIWQPELTVGTLYLTDSTCCWNLTSDSIYLLSEPRILLTVHTVGTFYLIGSTCHPNLIFDNLNLLLEPRIWLIVHTVRTLYLTASTCYWNLVSDSLNLLNDAHCSSESKADLLDEKIQW